jgi:hypothetical protein
MNYCKNPYGILDDEEFEEDSIFKGTGLNLKNIKLSLKPSFVLNDSW